jgi:hypothetical protein
LVVVLVPLVVRVLQVVTVVLVDVFLNGCGRGGGRGRHRHDQHDRAEHREQLRFATHHVLTISGDRHKGGISFSSFNCGEDRSRDSYNV